MEESKALSKLNDATDLLMLLEDILNPLSIERLSQASWSGVRLTLRNARATLQESQTALSKEFVARARSSQSINSSAISTVAPQSASSSASVVATPITEIVSTDDFSKNNSEQAKALITRRDLKATLEKFIENR